MSRDLLFLCPINDDGVIEFVVELFATVRGLIAAIDSVLDKTGVTVMKKTSVCMFLGLLVSFPVLAEGPLVRFDGGIGVQPLKAGPAPNTVQGVNPPGIPWVIARLSADVKTDGRISVDGRGLLLAGGNGIGTNGGQSVRARLFCGAVAHDSVLVPLQPNGDFRIDDVLSPLPTNPCDNPVLLIVNTGGSWFAAAIQSN